MKQLAMGLLMLVTLSGCALYTPDGSIVVDPGHHDGGGHRDGGHHDGRRDGGGGGGFCPPGQAKKGNC